MGSRQNCAMEELRSSSGLKRRSRRPGLLARWVSKARNSASPNPLGYCLGQEEATQYITINSSFQKILFIIQSWHWLEESAAVPLKRFLPFPSIYLPQVRFRRWKYFRITCGWCHTIILHSGYGQFWLWCVFPSHLWSAFPGQACQLLVY